MLSYKRAIFPLLVFFFALFFDLSVSAQCEGPGKSSFEVQGYASILITDDSYQHITGPGALGSPDGDAAYFANYGQSITVDLIDTVKAGQTYSFFWRQHQSMPEPSRIWWAESVDGTVFVSHPLSGVLSTSNKTFFRSQITANTDTRYLRIYMGAGSYDFYIDAISYTTVKCYSQVCGTGYSSRIVSGNALPLVSSDQNSVADYLNLSGLPDGKAAYFNSSGDWAILNLPTTIPAGQQYSLIWRPVNRTGVSFSVMTIEEYNGTSWGPQKILSSYTGESALFLSETVTASQNTNRIRVSLRYGSDYFYLDGLIFNALACLPPPPVLTVTGNYDYCGLPVLISPELTITDGANQILNAAYVQIGNGFQSGQDILGCTPAYGITSTYIPSHGLLILKGTATSSQYQSVLSTVTYSNSNPTPATVNRNIIISLERYNPATDHFYRYVPTTRLRWHEAKLNADRAHLFGMQGYLVTIGSDPENDFLMSQMTGGAVWIGASDFYSAEGDWRWETGPEEGTPFWLGGIDGTLLTYANWDDNEPNNANDQDFGQFLTEGTWDDNGYGIGAGIWRPDGFYVEFGGMPGDPVLNIWGSVNVNIVTGIPVNPVITGPSSVCPGAKGQTYSTLYVPGHNYFWEVSGGSIVGGQSTNSITVNWGTTSPGIVKVTERIGSSCLVTTDDYVVTIADQTAPTGTAPAGTTNINACFIDATTLPTGTPSFDAIAAASGYTDNCGGSVTATLTGTLIEGDDCGWTVTYTFTVEDACGNELTGQTIEHSGRDQTAPEFTVPSDITICRDATCGYDASLSNTNDVEDERDNCSVGIEAFPTDDLTNLSSCDTVGYIIRKWTLTDDCGNETVKYQTIWVQPVPRISVTVPDTIFCNNSTVEFAIDSLVVSRGEVMYDLDVNYPTGLNGTLTDGQNPIINISDQLTNSTDSYQTATYRFRPYIQGKPGDPTCNAGTEVTMEIHVEPTARVALTLSDTELCNGDSVNIELSTVTTAYSGIEFNVDAINSYPEITGFTDRTGLIVTDIITEALRNSGDTARLVTYIVTPATLDVNGNQKCTGINDTVRVWVNPTPRATPVNNAPHICYGDTTDVVLLSPTVMSSGINEFNYTITASDSTEVVGGNRAALNSVAPGTHLRFPYTNESDTMQSVFFRITPKVKGPGCPYGPRVISEVKVHPNPLQSLEILDSITCDGGQDGALQVIHARGLDSLMVAWTGPDYWKAADYNMFIAEECSQGYYTATVTDSLGCTSSAALNFLAPSIEVSLYFGQYISCPGAEDARMVVALTEGQAPPYYYSLLWNYTDTIYQGPMPPIDTFFSLDNLKPGEYLLTVEDGNGCREELPRTLYDAPVTFARFEKSLYADDNISCESYSDGTIRVSEIYSYYMDGTDTVIVSSRAPYTYQWSASNGGVISGSSTDSLLVNIPAGTYTLTVRDSRDCEFTFTETMTEPDGIDLIDEDVSLSNDGNYEISCYGGNDGFINLQFDGGTGDYGYAWTGPDGFISNTPSLTELRAGTYYLTVTDGNMCHREYTYILDEPDSISIAVSTSHTPGNAYNIGCNGGNGTIDITVAGGSGPGTYSYQWTKAGDQLWTSNQEDLTVKAGTYLLQVTDVNGCTNTRTIEITEPDSLSLSLVVSDITCLNAPAYDDGSIDLTVSGGKSPYTYSWTGPEGFTSSLEDISSLAVGSYTVTVTDAYGCSSTGDALLILPQPISLESRMSDYNGFSVSCLGKRDGWLRIIPQNGMAPYNYSWSGPAGFTADTDSIYTLSEGTYTVTVTDMHFCSVTQDIRLDSPGRLSMTLSIGLSNGGNFNINCHGASTGMVNLTAVNAAGTTAYLWSDGLPGAVRDNLTAGYHEVIVTDANGCVADTSLTLTEPDSLQIHFSLISPYCPESDDGSIFAGVTGGEGPYTFEWSNGQTTQEAVSLVQGLYTVETRDFNGCVLSDSLLLMPINDICVGIPNAFSPDGDGINEFWNITRISFYSDAEVIILNRWGEMVWKSEKGYPDPWDGRASNGKVLPMDSYHYAIDLHNGEKPIVGHVTIIR